MHSSQVSKPARVFARPRRAPRLASRLRSALGVALVAGMLTVWTTPVRAALTVLACEPEWAALVIELGGAQVAVSSATTAQQDPHRIEPRPSLLARARNADLLVCTGLELEAGWLPVLLQQSGNRRIQPGQPGFFEAGRQVTPLDVPVRLDRAQGDVHAGGNPHVHLDARNIARIADALVEVMVRLDGAQAALYRARHQDFSMRWRQALERWERSAAPLRGIPALVHHKNLDYLFAWLGLREVGTLEPKPGIEPSAAQLSALLEAQRTRPARLVLRAAYQDGRASEWIAQRARIPAVVLPFTVGGSAAAGDLFGLFDDTLARLLAATGTNR